MISVGFYRFKDRGRETRPETESPGGHRSRSETSGIKKKKKCEKDRGAEWRGRDKMERERQEDTLFGCPCAVDNCLISPI